MAQIIRNFARKLILGTNGVAGLDQGPMESCSFPVLSEPAEHLMLKMEGSSGPMMQSITKHQR
jgi:hypothetical protein